jgi:hypothetical protein
MPRMIDQIRAFKLPSNMMQFAARGALQVSPAENIEILVYLAVNNKVFGDLARMTLANWDEKASLAAASDPKTAREVLDYLISPDNLRPKLLPALLENPTVAEDKIAKFAISATRDAIEVMLASARVKAAPLILRTLKSNPYLRKNESEQIATLLSGVTPKAVTPAVLPAAVPDVAAEQHAASDAAPEAEANVDEPESTEDIPDEAVAAYMAEHAGEIAAEKDKPFQAIGGIVDLLGADYFPVSKVVDAAEQDAAETAAAEKAATAAAARVAKKPVAPVRENALQKINRLDIKGRIQLALKGNKEERSLLIRDGTKVVALAVLEAPKLSDGEVEKFASQKNVLEAVLRQIPLKRRFMKNYIVVRNMVANPRTPLDLGLGLMKNILPADLKNISANKEVSETIRKLALKMYKQKMDAANKK